MDTNNRDMRAWWGAKPRTITVVGDTPGWFDPFAQELVARINAGGDRAAFARTHAEIPSGHIAFYLSCSRITPPDVLARNSLNLVVHASRLPSGRGFSPLVWQVLEGSNEIGVTMIEAVEQVDAGEVFMRADMQLEGHELNGEMRGRLGKLIVHMCLQFLSAPNAPKAEAQVGEPTWYSRRKKADSRLDPSKTIAEQFPLLRVVDNERYPAFFDYRGHRYVLKIEDQGPTPKE